MCANQTSRHPRTSNTSTNQEGTSTSITAQQAVAVDGAGRSDYYGRRLFVVLVRAGRFANDRAATEPQAVRRCAPDTTSSK